MAKGVIADASTADSPQRPSGVPLPTRAALTIASHTLARRVGERCVLDALAAGTEVALARNTPDFVKPGCALGMSLADPFVSRKPIRLVPRGEGRIQITINEGSTAVTAGAPIKRLLEIGPGELLAGVPLELADRVVLLLHQVEADMERTPDALGMVGESAGIRRVRAHVERLADLHVPVLLRGETGTGKELVARALHDHGPRRGGPFVSVNLGAIPRIARRVG